MGGTRVRQEEDNLQYKNDYCERDHLIICRVGHVVLYEGVNLKKLIRLCFERRNPR